MKRYIACVLIMMNIGCKSMDRLVNGPEGPGVPDPELIGGLAPLADTAPEFGLVTPEGTERVVYHGALGLDGIVRIQAVHSPVRVFIRERLFPTGQWFILGQLESQKYWYSFNVDSGQVKFYGSQVETLEYCVYQYVPNN